MKSNNQPECNPEQEAIEKGNWKCSKQVCDMNVIVDEKL